MQVRPGEKPPSVFYTWKVRLAVETELVQPAAVDCAQLPAGVAAPTAAVWDGFVLLLGCKRLSLPVRGSTYTREFAAPWSGVSVRQARDALSALSGMGYLRNSSEKAGRATIWLPKPPDL
jgi:hypothetical protein